MERFMETLPNHIMPSQTMFKMEKKQEGSGQAEHPYNTSHIKLHKYKKHHDKHLKVQKRASLFDTMKWIDLKTTWKQAFRSTDYWSPIHT